MAREWAMRQAEEADGRSIAPRLLLQRTPDCLIIRISHPTNLGHKEGSITFISPTCLMISRNSASPTCSFLPTSQHCPNPHMLISVSKATPIQSHEAKLRQMPLGLRKPPPCPEHSCSRISCLARQ